VAPICIAAVLQVAPAQGGAQTALLLFGSRKSLDPIIKFPEESLYGQQFPGRGVIAQATREFEQLWQIGQWVFRSVHMECSVL